MASCPFSTAPGADDGAPIHSGGNLGFDWQGGDHDSTERAFAAARHVVSLRVAVPRILGLPLEPMSAVASYDPAAEHWTLVTPSQGAHAIQRELSAGYFGTGVERLRVITPEVGGAFGIRIHALPEQAALLGAARLLGGPVSWQADRSESNLCEPHARDFLVHAELAMDGEGRFLALRATADCALGAYVHPGARATPTASLLFGLQGAYRMPSVSLRVRGWYTNTTPTGPFRGAGQPEGTFVLERLIDAAARQIGLSAAELRARNVLTPSDLPYRSATGHLVDGSAAALLRQAEAWLAVQPRNTGDGRLRCGAGLALYMKVNGMGRQERAEVVATAGSDTVTARIGSQSNGQGHATTFGAIVAGLLGLPPDGVQVVQGDTDMLAFGTGTGASSALGTTGTGVSRSAADLLRRARTEAARVLRAEEDLLDYAAGSFTLRGSNRFVTLREVALEAGGELIGRSEVPVSLTVTLGCHACIVGVDPDTGTVCVPDAWDVKVSGWSNDSETSRFKQEGYQEPYACYIKQVTTKPVIGTGRFTSPDTMVSQLRRGILDVIGCARPSIADPFLPKKVEEDRLEDIRECIGCNICVSTYNLGAPINCTQNPTIGEEYKRGWHPERYRPAGSEDAVLIVGAGPAGLDAPRGWGGGDIRSIWPRPGESWAAECSANSGCTAWANGSGCVTGAPGSSRRCGTFRSIAKAP